MGHNQFKSLLKNDPLTPNLERLGKFGQFINPPYQMTSTVWEVGTIQQVRWMTLLESYDLSLWQQLPDMQGAKTSQFPLFTSKTEFDDGTLDWVVSIPDDLNLADSSTFFWRCNSSLPPSEFRSSYFTITERKLFVPMPTSQNSSQIPLSGATLPSQTTYSLSLETPAPTLTSSPTSTTLSLSESILADSQAATLRVGIGVTLGIGIPLLLFAGAFLAYIIVLGRRKHDPKARALEARSQNDGVAHSRDFEAPAPVHMLGATQSPVEMGSPSPAPQVLRQISSTRVVSMV